MINIINQEYIINYFQLQFKIMSFLKIALAPSIAHFPCVVEVADVADVVELKIR